MARASRAPGAKKRRTKHPRSPETWFDVRTGTCYGKAGIATLHSESPVAADSDLPLTGDLTRHPDRSKPGSTEKDFPVIVQSLTQGDIIMKLTSLSAVFGVLALCGGTAAAQSASLNRFQPKVMPVLVQVNSHGKITEASPAYALEPKLSRLLRENLDEMISLPATDKQGHPVSSQFIINLATQATPLSKGTYSVRFAYVSATPVPAGSWYWVHINGVQLALAPQHSGIFRHRGPIGQNQDPDNTNTPDELPQRMPASQTINQAPPASQSQAPAARGSERIR